MIRIKICELTNEEDVFNAINLGVDAVGFLLINEDIPQRIYPEKAKQIISKLPNHTLSVILPVSKNVEEIIKLCRELRPKAIQKFNITINELKKLREELPDIKILKTISVLDESSIEKAKKFENYCDFIHLDTKARGQVGGTGKTHNWNIDKKIVINSNKPVFVAGGLNPENVGEAIKIIKPYAVDVTSGVEKYLGKKDFEKMKKFIEIVRSFD